MSTEHGMVPTSAPPEGAPAPAPPLDPPTGFPVADAIADRRTQRRWTLIAVALFGLGCLVLAAATVRIDYVMLKPGSARPTSPVLVIDGTDVFTPDTEINFTTVALQTRVTPLQAIGGWLDPDIDVFEKEVILGSRSSEENRQVNIQLMDTSTQDAIRLALTTLGYDVPIVIDAVTISGIVEESNAADVLQVGENIVAIDGTTLVESDDIGELLAVKRPGDTVELTVEDTTRESTRTETVELIPNIPPPEPDPAFDPDRAIIGVSLNITFLYDFPFDIDIDAGTVGGPSAGLAFTLSILDNLTEGELTGGTEIAVTGTISPDGTVGAIGGVQQKVAAVQDQGIPVFLVPSGNFDEAQKKASDALQVIPVSTLSDALNALRSLGGAELPRLVDVGDSG